MTDAAAPDQPTPGPAVPLGEHDTAAAPKGRRSVRAWVVAGIVAAVAVVGAAVAMVVVADAAAIHDGPGTATFSWTPVSQDTSAPSGTPPPQPFTAEIDGHSVTGTASTVIDQSTFASLFGAGGSSRPVTEFRYTGRFAGKPFTLALSFQVEGGRPLTFATAPSAKLRFTVTGHYGNLPVRGTFAVLPEGPTSARPAHLTGSIGHWRISADLPPATGSSARQSATVHYVVSG
jgi:hypothetical protein